jgi:uncharacterized membrane protein YdjX (TVP38/TMEM64 family)
MTFKGSRRRRAIRLFAGIHLVIAVMGAVVAYLILMLEWGRDFSVESVRTTIEGLGVWGVFASIGLMVVHSFLPFPAEVVAIANGMFYGPVWGTVITWIGAMLGALGAFGLTRLLGQPFVAVMISERDQRRLDEWTERHGARLIFIARLVPVIAFNLINYAAGLTRISWWTFVWSTSLGILPFTMLMVVVGDRFMTMSWELWLSLLGGGVILWVLFRRWLNPRRRWRTPGTGG